MPFLELDLNLVAGDNLQAPKKSHITAFPAKHGETTFSFFQFGNLCVSSRFIQILNYVYSSEFPTDLLNLFYRSCDILGR